MNQLMWDEFEELSRVKVLGVRDRRSCEIHHCDRTHVVSNCQLQRLPRIVHCCHSVFSTVSYCILPPMVAI